MMGKHQALEKQVGLEFGFSLEKPVSLARQSMISGLKDKLNFSAKTLNFTGILVEFWSFRWKLYVYLTRKNREDQWGLCFLN